jgi:hypothetical protein
MAHVRKSLHPFGHLPLPGQHWVARRKARLVAAVLDGELTRLEVCQRYQLTLEEFQSWVTAYERYGVPGLRATHLGIYPRYIADRDVPPDFRPPAGKVPT